MRPLLALYRLALALLLLGPGFARAAIAPDGTAASTTCAAAGIGPITCSATLSTSGTNRTILACFGVETDNNPGDGDVGTVSGGGLSWSRVKFVGANNTNATECWKATAAAQLTSATISATWTPPSYATTANPRAVLVVAALTGVGSVNELSATGEYSASPLYGGFYGSTASANSWAWAALTCPYSTTPSIYSGSTAGATLVGQGVASWSGAYVQFAVGRVAMASPGRADILFSSMYFSYATPGLMLEVSEAPPPVAATPTSSLTAGTYTSTQTASLSTALGAVICYTLDGSTPATNGTTGCTTGTLYSSALSLAASETVKAVAGGTGFSDSSVASFAYVISLAPTVTSVSPGRCTVRGGCAVTIHGTNFRSGATATFGGTACTGLSVVDAATITCTVPAHTVGRGDVTVTDP